MLRTTCDLELKKEVGRGSEDEVNWVGVDGSRYKLALCVLYILSNIKIKACEQI